MFRGGAPGGGLGGQSPPAAGSGGTAPSGLQGEAPIGAILCPDNNSRNGKAAELT